LKKGLQPARPERRLVQEISFGLASTRHEHSVKSVGFARDFVAALAVAVDVEAHGSLQAREYFRIRPKTHPDAGWKNVAAASMADPPSGTELSHHSEKKQKGGNSS
jgi:hypothetical protein